MFGLESDSVSEMGVHCLILADNVVLVIRIDRQCSAGDTLNN